MLRGCPDRWGPVAAVSVSTPDRTSNPLVRTSNSVLGGRAFLQVRNYPRTLLCVRFRAGSARGCPGVRLVGWLFSV